MAVLRANAGQQRPDPRQCTTLDDILRHQATCREVSRRIAKFREALLRVAMPRGLLASHPASDPLSYRAMQPLAATIVGCRFAVFGGRFTATDNHCPASRAEDPRNRGEL